MKFPSDFHPIVINHRTYFNAGYRVPWGARILKSGEGSPIKFNTHQEATIAACKAAMGEFRNQTTGWQESPLLSHQKEIERVFSGKPS